MSGQELIDFITENHLEDYDFAISRGDEGKDWLYAGMDAEIDHIRKEVVI